MQIRPSTPTDVERLFELWHAAVLATHDFLSPDERAEIADIVRTRYLPAARLEVAVDASDRPVGFLGMDDAHIESLFVDPAHHGKGIGSALIAHARKRHPVLTVSVNEQNPGATAFYERLGFARTGRSPTDDAGRPFPLVHLRLG